MTVRAEDGLNRDDRMVAGLVNLAYAQLMVTMLANGAKKHRLPTPLEFLPMPPEPKPDRPTDFVGWARMLLPLAA